MKNIRISHSIWPHIICIAGVDLSRNQRLENRLFQFYAKVMTLCNSDTKNSWWWGGCPTNLFRNQSYFDYFEKQIIIALVAARNWTWSWIGKLTVRFSFSVQWDREISAIDELIMTWIHIFPSRARLHLPLSEVEYFPISLYLWVCHSETFQCVDWAKLTIYSQCVPVWMHFLAQNYDFTMITLSNSPKNHYINVSNPFR